MNQLIAVFQQLGVDATIFQQFAIFVIFFAIIKVLLFDKLQFVIELRENKTTKLASLANKKLQDADRLAKEYREKMSEANKLAQDSYKVAKNEIIIRERKKYQEAQKEIIGEMERERKIFETQLNEKRSSILSQADSLANELVNKLS